MVGGYHITKSVKHTGKITKGTIQPNTFLTTIEAVYVHNGSEGGELNSQCDENSKARTIETGFCSRDTTEQD